VSSNFKNTYEPEKNNKRIFIIIKFDFEIFFIVVGKEKLDKEELDIKSV